MPSSKEYNRMYYLANRERILANNKKRVENYTPEEKAKREAYQRGYRKSYMKRYNQENREKLRAKMRENYIKKRESRVKKPE